MTRTNRRRGSWGFFVFLFIASIAIIVFGSWLIWAQHSGTPARVAPTTCDSGSHRRASDRAFDSFFGSCRGPNPAATGGQFVEIWGSSLDDLGHELDVHVVRGTGVFDVAVIDSWKGPLIVLAVGGLAAAGTLVAIAVRIARRPKSVPFDPHARQWPGSG